MKKSLSRLALIFAATAALSACGSFNGYREGVAGNVALYREHVTVMMSQQNSINACFNAAGARSGDLALCAVLAAGTNPTQVLAGRPEPIRIPKSKEEILESVASTGLDAAVKIYGFKAVAGAIGKGFDALAVQPEVIQQQVVRPEIVRPEVIHAAPAAAPAVVPAATVVTTTP